jgi:hypothetical protein
MPAPHPPEVSCTERRCSAEAVKLTSIWISAGATPRGITAQVSGSSLQSASEVFFHRSRVKVADGALLSIRNPTVAEVPITCFAAFPISSCTA